MSLSDTLVAAKSGASLFRRGNLPPGLTEATSDQPTEASHSSPQLTARYAGGWQLRQKLVIR
jgi:hypothetical protein